MTLHDIDGVQIPFDTSWKNISIAVSGGADSALLTYLLSEIITKTKSNTDIHIISHTRMWKTRPWQQQDSLRVFEYFTKNYDINYHRYTNFIAPDLEHGNNGTILVDEYGKSVSGDNIQQRSFAEYICTKHKIDCFYNGVTKNPPIDISGHLLARNVERTEDNKHLELMEHLGFTVSHPFRFIDKSWIMKQYFKNDIQQLLDLTRSCEGEFKGIDYTNYKPGQYVPVCNECFWCKERAWAIEQSK